MSANPPRRRYTNNERANAVAAVAVGGGSVHGTAKKLGIPETSLRQWHKGQRCRQVLPLSEQKRLELADRFEEVIHQAVEVVVEKLSEASAAQAAVIAGIACDKMLLLRREGAVAASERGGDGHTMNSDVNATSLSLSASAIAAARVLLDQVVAPTPASLEAEREAISPHSA